MNSWQRTLFTNFADGTALATFTAEASLLAGSTLADRQPVIPANWFDSVGKAIRIRAGGVLGSTGTPTYIFQFRIGTTVGDADLSGTSVGVSPTITTQSGVSTQLWEAVLDIICTVPGVGGTATTLSCSGLIHSPGGFASPFAYALAPTTPPTATWTTGINGAVQQYVNVSVTCGTSSGSNTVTLKKLILEALN